MGLEELAVIGTVISVAASVAGGIVQYQAQQTQASNAQKIANYNAAVQQQQADTNQRLAVRQAEINNQYLQSQYNQTTSYDNQAAALQAQAAEQIRRNQEQEQQMLSRQRAAYAQSGVLTDTGSPLSVLADTASLFELQNQDTQYEADTQSAALKRQAELARYGLTSDIATQQLNESAAYASKDIGYQQAQITRLSGDSQAQGYRTASYGSLLSGVSSIGTGTTNIAGVLSRYQARAIA